MRWGGLSRPSGQQGWGGGPFKSPCKIEDGGHEGSGRPGPRWARPYFVLPMSGRQGVGKIVGLTLPYDAETRCQPGGWATCLRGLGHVSRGTGPRVSGARGLGHVSRGCRGGWSMCLGVPGGWATCLGGAGGAGPHVSGVPGGPGHVSRVPGGWATCLGGLGHVSQDARWGAGPRVLGYWGLGHMSWGARGLGHISQGCQATCLGGARYPC